MNVPTVNFQFIRNSRKAFVKSLIRTSDGDTPVIEQSIRMVFCDTPDKAHYAGGPDKAQMKLDKCRKRLQNGFYNDLPEGLIDYLIERFANDSASN